MSDNSIAGGCLTHHNDQHIQVRKDFFDLCAYDKADFNQSLTKTGKKAKDEPNQECMAKILRLLETLTNQEKYQWYLKAQRLKAKGIKAPNEPTEHRIELAYSTISTLLYGTYGESTIRNSIAVLLQRGYILRYQETKNSIPCYVLNIPVLQSALSKQAQEASLEQVSKSTSEESEISKVTSQVSKSTAQGPKSIPEISKSTPNNIIDKKDLKKEDKREKPIAVQEPSTSPAPDVLSSSLSSQKSSEETKPTEVDYPLFDDLCREKGYAPDFKVPRNDKNNAAIQELRSQSATPEQVEFVFNDIWDDPDLFWKQHRGKPSTVASQFTARVWKMTAPAPKRQTASGMTNWTEDKAIGAAKPLVEPIPETQEKPKERPLAPDYTRMPTNKPRRPRTAYGRMLEAQKGEL